ncbi:MAG: hypothetical protein H7Y28_01655 [Rhodoferax sp.]|nr:hypothetical protein [Rhodoferax sp.]
MTRIRGWGLLLVLCIPLLVFFSWDRLGAESSRINLERYETWSAENSGMLMRPLLQYFAQNKKPAAPGDMALPAVPKNSGIKTWALQPDTILLVELDAKVDGRVVRLKYVPLVRSENGIFYDCVSATSPVQVGRFCRAEVLKSEADIPAQLEANARVLGSMPPTTGASGSVVAVPGQPSDLNSCGFQCVKPQSCATPRPLACGVVIDEGNSRWLEVTGTPEAYRGSDFATRNAADRVCEQVLGAGHRLAAAASLGGVFKLTGGNEYWVHNDVRTEANCWATDTR